MIVFGVYCYHCNTFIYSRARHDMNCCRCWNKDKRKAVAIDGGQEDYFKLTTGKDCNYKLVKMNIQNASIERLYDDWNTNKNNFGLKYNPNHNDFISIMEKE